MATLPTTVPLPITPPKALTAAVPTPSSSNIAPAVGPNIFSQADLTGTATQQFDASKMAGTMTGSTDNVVGSNSLVSNQLNSLIAQDSPYIQMARTRAAQVANERGLVNSSMAAGAGEAAAIDRAMPIAQQDADTYGKSSMFNSEQRNIFSRDQNNFQRDSALQKQSAMNNMEGRGQDAAIATNATRASQVYQSGEADENRQFQASQDATAFDNRMSEMDYAQRFQSSETEKLRAFQVSQEATAFTNRISELGYTSNLAKANVPVNFAVNVQEKTMNSVNAIIADPTLSPEAKQGAIKNLVDYSNQTLAWGESMFGVQYSKPVAATRP